MATTTILEVSVWKQGAAVSCNTLSLNSISDNLTSSATFYFQVGTTTAETFTPETEGNLTCSAENYIDWRVNSFSTDWILTWACGQLNLTKV